MFLPSKASAEASPTIITLLKEAALHARFFEPESWRRFTGASGRISRWRGSRLH
jgi:hypothetical protein